MDFALERLTPALRNELEPLFVDHYQEISANLDIPLNPKWDFYEAIKDNVLRVFTIRDEGKLVGYGVFIVGQNHHYADSKQANQDILFLTKALRGKLTGYRFVQWCDDRLRDEGCQIVYHHVKFAHDFGPMLERIGYKQIEKIYGRRLDR